MSGQWAGNNYRSVRIVYPILCERQRSSAPFPRKYNNRKHGIAHTQYYAVDFWDKHTLARQFTGIFGDYQDLGLQAKNGQFGVAVVILARARDG